MSKQKYTTRDRLQQIAESIAIIQERCQKIASPDDFLLTPDGMMVFDSCVMRLQAIGEQVGKLLQEEETPLAAYNEIPWKAIYGLRNVISHEYANVDETIIFSAIKDELPKVNIAVQELLQRLSDNLR